VVEKGDYIVDGNPAPHDILAIKGVEELAALSRQRDPGGLPAPGREHQRQAHRGDRPADAAEGRDHRRGDSDFLAGEQVDRIEMDEINEKLEAEGKKPADGAIPVLLGITKASCRPAPSSRRRPSRRPPASSPRRRSTASTDTLSTASRRTSSSAASSRRAPAQWWIACVKGATRRDELIVAQKTDWAIYVA
jgi:DNA-directed RNA polymerase subunit beta'